MRTEKQLRKHLAELKEEHQIALKHHDLDPIPSIELVSYTMCVSLNEQIHLLKWILGEKEYP